MLASGLALALVAACLLVPGSTQAAPACTVEGGPRVDHLEGTGAADVIHGRGGADRLLAETGGELSFKNLPDERSHRHQALRRSLLWTASSWLVLQAHSREHAGSCR